MREITFHEANLHRDDPEWRASFAALKKSLRSKRGSGYPVGTITEDDKYDNEPHDAEGEEPALRALPLDGLRRF
jgi:hypothetical protein